jgi:ATP-binding cassette subfamily B protein/subfamily B ATP-binding cassette protein MsbA
MLSLLYPYWRPACWVTLAGMLLLLVAGVLELLLPWPIKWLVDYVFAGRPAPSALAELGLNSKNGDPTRALAWVCGAILVLGIAHKAAQMFSQFLLIRAGLQLVKNLRLDVSDHLHRLSLRYHDRTKVGDSIYRAAYDTYAAQSLLSGVAAPVLTGIIILVGIVVVMLRLDGLLTLIALAVGPTLGLTIWAFGRRIERQSRQYHEQEIELVCTMQETLSAIRFIQAYTREAATAERVGSQAGQSVLANERLSLTQLGFSACVGLTMVAGTAAAVYVGAIRVLEGRILVGDVLVFLAYLGMLYTPVNAFAQSAQVLRSARSQLDRVFEVLRTGPEIISRPGAIELSRLEGRVEFRGVSFAYEPGGWALSGLDLVVPSRTVAAIVGSTGAGKSTLASLLLRFYDPAQGAVLIDGHDLRDLRLEWLRRRVALVPQDAILISGTIAENIAFGKSQATRREIIEAACRAQADAFIRQLPEGYETVLGERGVNLSGGQRQRLSLARAFLKDAPILILDEPTSALDAHTEAALLDSMRELIKGRTTFIIAHRLSTIRAADIILVMERGRLVESGKHEMLIGRDTAYRRLYQAQWRSQDAAANGHLAMPPNVVP